MADRARLAKTAAFLSHPEFTQEKKNTPEISKKVKRTVNQSPNLLCASLTATLPRPPASALGTFHKPPDHGQTGMPGLEVPGTRGLALCHEHFQVCL